MLRKFKLEKYTQRDLKEVGEYLKSLDSGEYWVVVSDRNRYKLRTNQQNKYYWGVVLDIISDSLGIGKQELHRYFLNKFHVEILHIPTANGEDVVTVPGSTRSMSKEQFTEYIDQIKDWYLHEFGEIIPDADNLPLENYVETLEDG